MPTYEYECKYCGRRFELIQKMTDRHKKTCPKCGKAVRRLIGAGTGIIFKGSGFYATDYRKPGYRTDKQGEKEDKPKASCASTCSQASHCEKRT